MPRKAKPAAPQMAPEVGTVSPPETQREMQVLHQHQQHLQSIDLKFALDNEPYDYLRVLAYAQALAAMQAQGAFMLGRACLLLKEHEPEGRFLHALQEIGIEPRTARRYMTLVRKFEGTGERKLLAGKLAVSKLLELSTEDDDALDALAAGGSLAGATLDEIDRMTRSELREALRKERAERQQERAATDELVEKKDKKLNDLSRKFRNWERSPLRDKAEALLKGFDVEAVGVFSAVSKLNECYQGLLALYHEGGERLEADIAEHLGNSVDELIERLGALREEIG